MAKANGILDMPVKEREVRVGDMLWLWGGRMFRQGTVTRVTAKYIWLDRYSPFDRKIINVKRHRDAVLIDTKYY